MLGVGHWKLTVVSIGHVKLAEVGKVALMRWKRALEGRKSERGISQVCFRKMRGEWREREGSSVSALGRLLVILVPLMITRRDPRQD